MGQRYVRVLTHAGAVPWLVPLLPDDEATLRAVYERLDGVFLTGGVDVDPESYGESRHELCDRTDPARDRTELTLIRWAVADRKPVLGVCRGTPRSWPSSTPRCGGCSRRSSPRAITRTNQADTIDENDGMTG